MPIVNGKYESPIWENNHQPAMDAAEMQAITDSVEESIHALGDYTTPAQKMGLTGDLSVGASLGVLANIRQRPCVEEDGDYGGGDSGGV